MREREALKLALATLQDYVDEHGPWNDDCGVRHVLRLCKKALAQPEQELIDSDEMASEYMAGKLLEFVKTAATFPKAKVDSRLWNHVMVFAPKQSEPVAWQVKYRDDEGMPQIVWLPHPVHPKSPLAKKPYTEEPVYTDPPQSKPLTDEEISDMWCEVSNTDFVTGDTHVFARAIEAAHGIKKD